MILMSFKMGITRRFLAYIAIVMIIANIFYLLYTITRIRASYYELGVHVAEAFFESIVVTRRWNSAHGGVYVPVTANLQPNPYLEDPLRDLETLENIKLTKVNPAFMTRLISELLQETSETSYKITSLKPINPVNEPDDWERKSLEMFETGIFVNHNLASADNDLTYLRYMAPLITEISCLQCHEMQGYQAGDIRGGISVTLPFDFFLQSVNRAISSNIITHTIVLIASLGFLGFFGLNYLKGERALTFRLEFEKVISEISSTFVNLPAQKIDEGINYALSLTGDFFQADRSYVYQFSPDGTTMSNTHEWCREGIEPMIATEQDITVNRLPWWSSVIHNMDYVFIPDVSALPEAAAAEKQEFQRQSIQSLFTVPLKKEGQVVGFFGYDYVNVKKEWAKEYALFLKNIADILVNAFEKSKAEQIIQDYAVELELKGTELGQLYRQLDEEMDKARIIHERSLLKEIPQHNNLALTAFYRPAQRLGGDFYYVIREGSKMVIFVSDVSGHSLEGTLLTAFIREAIDSYLTLQPDTIKPGLILRHLHQQYLRDNYPDDYFICIFLLVIDLDTMELTYTSAGFQEEPLVKTGDGERRRFLNFDPPISNVFTAELMSFSEGNLILTPGTTIMVTTDGLTEHQSSDGSFYGDRLADVFYKNSSLPPEKIKQAINEDFRHFTHGLLQCDDDITYVIIQLTEPKALVI